MTTNTYKNKSLLDLMPKGSIEEEILEQRAKHLKKGGIIAGNQTAHMSHYVRFTLGKSEHYGIPFENIAEVMLNISPTKVPHTPNYIAGVINRNGALISVLDLQLFFQIQCASKTNSSNLIIISSFGINIAVLTDNIVGSQSYDIGTLDAPLNTKDAIKPKYLLGLHHGKIALLDMAALLTDLQPYTSSPKENV